MQSHTIIIIFQVILGQVLIMIAMTLVSLLVQSPSVPSMVHLWLAICQVETKINVLNNHISNSWRYLVSANK